MIRVHNRDLTHFYGRLRDSEIDTVRLLGCKMEVLAKEPIFKLKVTIVSPKFNGGKAGAACVIIFHCPRFYPARMPTIEVNETHNFPDGFENLMFFEFENILSLSPGMQMIMPITTRAQSMVNDLEKPFCARKYT